MPSAFSEIMAQMIAQARPPRAPGQTMPRVMGGGVLGTEQAGTASVGIRIPRAQDIEALWKLFGRVPTDELAKHVEGISLRLRESGPEEQKRIMDSPWTQATLGLLRRRGVPLEQYGFVATGERTPSGLYRYAYVPTLGEKMPPEERAVISAYGPTAAAALKGRREEIAAAAPVREAEVEERRAATEYQRKRTELLPEELRLTRLEKEAAAEARRAEAEYRREAAKLLPQEAELNRMKIQTEAEHQNLLREQAKLVGPELEAKRAESAAKLGLLNRQMKQVDLEMLKTQKEIQQLSTDISKNEQAAMLSIDRAFDDFRKSWMQKTAAYGAMDELTAYREILELEGAVRSHISGMHTYVKDKNLAAKASERSVRTIFAIIDREFERPTIQPGLFGTGKADAAQQLARRRYYVGMAAELLRDSGITSPDLLAKLEKWAGMVGISTR